MFNNDYVQVKEESFVNWMNRPDIIHRSSNYDQFLLGLTYQPMKRVGPSYAEKIKSFLFRGFGPYGQDMASLDIERGRDHGIRPYVHYLEVCRGHRVTTFSDLKLIPKHLINKLQLYYNSVEDIDLIVGGILENKVPGTRLGATFLCLITEQFYRIKFGDRFWYEVKNQTHSFSLGQLREIRKITLSRLICNNSDNITRIAPDSLLPPSKTNPIVDCSSIPNIDLSIW